MRRNLSDSPGKSSMHAVLEEEKSTAEERKRATANREPR